jgi:hypothetical protein
MRYWIDSGFWPALRPFTLRRPIRAAKFFLKVRRHKVKTVAFRSNVLQQVTVTPDRLLLSRGELSNKFLHQDLSKLTTFYKNRGYEEIKVDPDVVDRGRQTVKASWTTREQESAQRRS